MYHSFIIQANSNNKSKPKSKLSKIECTQCQNQNLSCDRYLPSCQLCYNKNQSCTYISDNMILNTFVNFDNAGIQFPPTDTAVISWKMKPNSPSSVKSKNKTKKEIQFNSVNVGQFRIFKNKPKISKSIYTNWRNVAIVRLILKNSYLDTDSTFIYKTASKELEYYGQSPIGGLLTVYYDLQQKMDKAKDRMEVKKSDVFSLNRSQIQEELIEESIFTECSKAYFTYYARFCPIIDELSFDKKDNLMLKRLVAGVGAKYLPKGAPIPGLYEYLDNQILLQFQTQFPKPTLDLVICLLLMCQFQNVPSQFKNTWIYHGYAVSLATTLGLHLPLPKEFQLSEREIRIRAHVWWTLCIHDKIAFHFTNRPILINGTTLYQYPKLAKLPRLSEEEDKDEFIIAREYLASTYFKCYTELAELLGHVHGCIKIRFSNNREKANELCGKLMLKIANCYQRFFQKMNSLVKDQPKWLIELAIPLMVQNFSLMNVMIIRLCQYFLKYKDSKEYKFYLIRGLFSARLITIAVESLGPYYFRFGIAYLFYALSAASLFFAYCLDDKDEGLRLFAKDGLKRAIKLIDYSRPYFAICEEFYIKIMEVVGDDMEFK
ncbi:hypothetical protein K502DRAFT_352621 [Neoconidiobolus thromboides FSU 785]|nr:hypothetical protein K502DRAFT_352621 [Neoconidiobolus thromboides FSU 785]